LNGENKATRLDEVQRMMKRMDAIKAKVALSHVPPGIRSVGYTYDEMQLWLKGNGHDFEEIQGFIRERDPRVIAGKEEWKLGRQRKHNEEWASTKGVELWENIKNTSLCVNGKIIDNPFKSRLDHKDNILGASSHQLRQMGECLFDPFKANWQWGVGNLAQVTGT
jgi:hypothetical protein